MIDIMYIGLPKWISVRVKILPFHEMVMRNILFLKSENIYYKNH